VTLQTAESPIAWSWLKSISRELYSLDQKPLLGQAPDFPWEKLTQEFIQAFGLESLKITPGELVWKEKKEVVAKLDTGVLCTQITATGMEGSCSLRMLHEDVEHIMAKVLQISEVESELQTEDVVQSFHRFLSIETLSLINKIGYDPRLSFKIISYDTAAPESALCQDIKIELGKEKMLARLIISGEFLQSWRTFFSQAPAPSPNLNEVETTIHLEVGKTALKLDELLAIRPGDLLLLDQFYGESILITLHGKPLFRASRDGAGLKILELSLQSEANTPMEENVNEAATEPPDLAPTQQEPPPEDENPFPDEEEEADEGAELVEAAKAAPGAQAEPKAEKKSLSAAKTAEPKSDKLSAKDIPIQLIVEVAAVNLSVQKLLELAPGNLIDLDISPESGVNLVVNGRVVGRGEMIKIGETIGVRVLQIGV